MFIVQEIGFSINYIFKVFLSDSFDGTDTPFTDTSIYTEILDVPGDATAETDTHDLSSCYTGRYITVHRTIDGRYLDIREFVVNTPESAAASCSG